MKLKKVFATLVCLIGIAAVTAGCGEVKDDESSIAPADRPAASQSSAPPASADTPQEEPPLGSPENPIAEEPQEEPPLGSPENPIAEEPQAEPPLGSPENPIAEEPQLEE